MAMLAKTKGRKRLMNNDERIISLLEELVAWSRLSARPELLPFLQSTLADPKHLKAFELTDGNRTQQQVADGAGLSQPAVSGLWTEWRRLGIARDKNGKAAHIVSPSDFGLEVPATIVSDGKPAAKKSKAKVAPAPTIYAAAVDGVRPE
jgi:hypothetical protein